MSGTITRKEALARKGLKHACHVMLYGDSGAKLFGKVPIKHIVLMQMRFDGLLGFPGGLVNPSQETLEEGLSRELEEEVGVAVAMDEADHVTSCFSPSCSRLVTHFYVKKLTEWELMELEKASVAAADHGLEALGMVRVPLYSLKSGGGLPKFLSHSFVENSRSQLLFGLHHCGLLSQGELDDAGLHSGVYSPRDHHSSPSPALV